MECRICLETYNDYKRVPWTLSCGHKFCSLCIILVIKQGPLNCPYCRIPHNGSILPSHINIYPSEVTNQSEECGNLSEKRSTEECSNLSQSSTENETSTPEIDSRVERGNLSERSTEERSNLSETSAPELSNRNERDNLTQRKPTENETATPELSRRDVDLLRLRETVINANAEGSSVWACLITEQGEPRCAKLTIWENKLHLHALKTGQPPPNQRKIPYQTARQLVDDETVVIFLEVYWEGEPRGMVYIVLLDDEGRTKQFRALCTGELGPSYTGTRFLEVVRMDGLEQVWAGDYENNDGTGGEALPGMQRGQENNQPCVAGLVAGYYFSGFGQDHNPAQFTIYPKNVPYYYEMSSIGRVVHGLELINFIANMKNCREAMISSSGYLLTH